MAESDEKIVKLKSSDGKIFSVSYNIIKQSKMISDMSENDMIIDDDSPVPLMNVDAATLEKIIEWLSYHVNDPIKEEDEDKNNYFDRRSDDISDWDTKFLAIDQVMLFKIILAANFLDIKGLLDISCKTVANMIKDKSVDEIKKTFRITNTFTPEEIEEIKRENEWCEKE